MKVSHLIQILSALPEDLEIIIGMPGEGATDFDREQIRMVGAKVIHTVHEDKDRKPVRFYETAELSETDKKEFKSYLFIEEVGD